MMGRIRNLHFLQGLARDEFGINQYGTNSLGTYMVPVEALPGWTASYV